MSVNKLWALLLIAGAVGCGGETDGGPDGSGADGGTSGTDGAVNPGNTGLPARWEIANIGDEGNSGWQPTVARAADGTIGVAFYRKTPMSTGRCMKMGMDLGPLDQWDLLYSESRAGGAFTAPERVATVTVQNLSGVALAFDDSGNPAVAYMSGEDGSYRCGGTDLVLSRKSGASWTTTTIDGDGNATPFFEEDAMACANSQNVCNSGDTVGEWPALAFVGGVPVVAYRDIHFAFAMNDFDNADVEMSWGGQRSSLDATWGGGTYNQIVVGSGGRVHVAHWNRWDGAHWRVRGTGIFVISGTQGAWTRTRVTSDVNVGYTIGFAGSGAKLGVAYHASGEQKLRYVEAPDSETWGSPEVVDQTGNTGLSPALAYDSAGAPAIAFHACGPYMMGAPDCPQDKDALRYASKASGSWKKMDVQANSGLQDGVFNTLVFGPDGMPVIIYQSIDFDPATGDVLRRLKVARGRS